VTVQTYLPRWLADQHGSVTSTASARPYSPNMWNGCFPRLTHLTADLRVRLAITRAH
jgi:hypothetical protein